MILRRRTRHHRVVCEHRAIVRARAQLGRCLECDAILPIPFSLH